MRILGVLAVLLALTACGSSEPDPADVNGDDIAAQVVCRDFVRDSLKSPSTADFSDERVRHVGGKVWLVAGSVDSENSFGAMIRNDYVCKVEYVSGDRYRLLNLRGLRN